MLQYIAIVGILVHVKCPKTADKSNNSFKSYFTPTTTAWLAKQKLFKLNDTDLYSGALYDDAVRSRICEVVIEK